MSHPEAQQQQMARAVDALRERQQKLGATAKPAKTVLERVMWHLENLVIISVCGFLLYQFDVINVMLYSKRIYRWLLYAALASHGFGFAHMTYSVWFTMPNDIEMKSERGQREVMTMTASFALGTVLWIIAVWPVFHFWTLLLAVAFLFFIVPLMGMFPGRRSTKSADLKM